MTPDRPPWRASRCAFVLVVVFSSFGCRPEDTPPTAGESLREGVDMVMYQMRTFVTREGIRRALIESDTAEFVGESEIHLRPVTMTFYDEDGNETTRVTANFGIYYELTEDMDAQGAVVALDRVDDQRLETERLRYVSAEDRLYSETAFTMYSDGGATTMRGASFESDPGLDSVRVMTPSGQTSQPLGALAPSTSPAGPLDSSSVVPDSSAGATASAGSAAISRPEPPTTPPDTSNSEPATLRRGSASKS